MNIAVLLDGTWSDANTHTNIAQIAARVPRRVGGAAQEVCYIQGVGTGPFDRLQGGILGAGLDDDIRQAYSFIAAHRRSDDDRIHLIGYSRGAFAARSLAGMIQVRDPPRGGAAGEGSLRSVPRHERARLAGDAGGRETRPHRRGRTS